MKKDRDYEKLKEVAEGFYTVWGEEMKNLEEKEKEFMQLVNDAVWQATRLDDVNMKESVYEADTFYLNISKIIYKYQEIYHMVYSLKSWKERQ